MRIRHVPAFLLIGLAALFSPASAQTRTIVSGTISGTDGVPWTGAQLTAIWNNPNVGIPPTLTPCNQGNGCPYPNPSVPPTTVGTAGAVQPFGVWSNTSILPSGSTYTFFATIYSAPPLGTGPQTCTVAANANVTGANFSITTTSCPALSFGAGTNGVQLTTVSGLAGLASLGKLAIVTDGANATDCSTGASSLLVLCQYNGTTWNSVSSFSMTLAALPKADSGIPYSGTLTVGGGVGPYQFATASANPQNGLTLNTGPGTVTGTPNGNGNGAWLVTVTDSTGRTSMVAVSVSVGILTNITVTPNPVNANLSTSTQFKSTALFSNATQLDITTTGTWSLSGCPGNSIGSGTGLVSSWAASGTCTVTSTLNSISGTATATVTSATGNPTIQTTNPLPNGQINQPYSVGGAGVNGSLGVGQGVQLVATGGVGPYTCSITAGSLPAGLSLANVGGNTNCLITGIPTASGAGTSLTIKIADTVCTSSCPTLVLSSGITIDSLNNGLAVNVGQSSIAAGTATSLNVVGTYSPDSSTAAIPIALGGSGASRVQGTFSSFSNVSNTTFTVQFAGATTAGHAYFVVPIALGQTISSVTTSQSDTCTQAVAGVANGENAAIFHCLNVAGGTTTTITAHFAAATSFGGMFIEEDAGILTAAALDQHNSGTISSGTSVSSGNITNLNATDYLIAFAIGDFNITAGTPGSSPTWSILQNPSGDWLQGANVSATSTYSATFTMQSSGNALALIASYKANAAPTGSTVITSNNTNCVTIPTAGTPQAIALNVSQACGPVTLTATGPGAASGTTQISVTVTNPDTGISVIPSTQNKSIGGTQTFQCIGNKSSNPYTCSWGVTPPSGIASLSVTSGTSTTATCNASGQANINAQGTVNGTASQANAILNCAAGTTLNMSDCSQAQLQAQWNALQPGIDTIVFPSPCPSTSGQWTTNLTLTQPSSVTNLTLQGSTIVNCTGTHGTSTFACAATDNTIIQDNETNSNPLLTINTGPASSFFRMTGLTFQAGTGSAKNNGFITFGGATQNFRFDHINCNNFTSLNVNGGYQIGCITFFTVVYGVADHDLLQMYSEANAIRFYPGSGDFGDGLWSQATQFGSQNFFFAEDDEFFRGAANDCNDGGRMVIRYSTILDNPYASGDEGLWQGHQMGQGTQRDRGCRALEIYNNYILNTGPVAFGPGGGQWTSLVHDNTITGYNFDLNFQSDREIASGHTQTAPPQGIGYCGNGSTGSTSGWDGNQTAASGYPCIDQTGRGQGDLLNGLDFPNAADTVTGMISWPHNLREPWYIWNETCNGCTDIYTNVAQNGVQMTPNRDFYVQASTALNPSCSGAFNGTCGVGTGLLSARPATCTAGPGGTFDTSPGGGSYGVGYFATDTKTLYVCSSTNTWTALASPATYPHPLNTGP